MGKRIERTGVVTSVGVIVSKEGSVMYVEIDNSRIEFDPKKKATIIVE